MPDSLDEALALAGKLQNGGLEFDWVAGGTDLLPNYKWHLNHKPNVISLANVEELTTLTASHIGAMVRLNDLVESEDTHSLVQEAAGSIASILIRRSGTVGGNICLDTRCFWFNQGEEWRESIDWCLKCDCGTGADCRVIPNQNTLCVATYQADLAPALMCLGATIHLASPGGKREMLLADFFQEDGITRNLLEAGEMVTHITLPEEATSLEGAYQKLRLRESWDFPEAGVAAAWRVAGGKLLDLRVATTGLESIPKLHREEADSAREDWAGQSSVNGLSEIIRKAVKPVNNTFFPPSYRRKMVRILAKRALSKLQDISAAN